MNGWTIEAARGSAAEFHARVLPDPVVPTIWILDVDRPALVLGSTQPAEVADQAACRRAGIEVVRRRSGGGAVLLEPGGMVWVDVVIPRDHPRWIDDVGRSMWWVGEAGAAGLGELGIGPVSVHRGGLEATPWSRLICFAGLGPGEVTLGGPGVVGEGDAPAAKVLGISQRRSRQGARFQCMVSLRWSPELLVSVLASPKPRADDLRGIGADLDVDRDRVVDAVLRALTVDGDRR